MANRMTLDMLMTGAMCEIINHVGNVLDSKRGCIACKDKTRCMTCTFNQNKNKSEE